MSIRQFHVRRTTGGDLERQDLNDVSTFIFSLFEDGNLTGTRLEINWKYFLNVTKTALQYVLTNFIDS